MKKLLIILALIIVPAAVSAHNTGLSIEKSVGGYKFDIGYSDEFVAGSLVRFDFDLYKDGSDKAVDFTSIWVRIDQGTETVFAGPLANSEFGPAGMSLVFPRAGSYTLSARFEKNGDKIAEESFPIEVKPAPASGGAFPTAAAVSGIVGLVIGAGLGRLFTKKHA